MSKTIARTAMGSHAHLGLVHDAPHLHQRAPRLRQARSDLGGPLEAVTVEQIVAGEDLLGLGERPVGDHRRSEEHTSELQSHHDLVCRLLLEKKKKKIFLYITYKKKKKKIIYIQ